MESGARVEDQVREHLRPGETFRAAIWASRPDDRAPGDLTRADISPFRFRRTTPGVHSGIQGSPRSLAGELNQHLRIVTEPRVLALTDRRVMVLSRVSVLSRVLPRPSGGPAPALRLRWEGPREKLAAITEKAPGRLRLSFTDGSALTLLTPAAQAGPFLAG